MNDDLVTLPTLAASSDGVTHEEVTHELYSLVESKCPNLARSGRDSSGSRTETGNFYPDLRDKPCDDQETHYDYKADKPLLFYGHYWRKWNPEQLPEWVPEKELDWTKNTACLISVHSGMAHSSRTDGMGRRRLTPITIFVHRLMEVVKW